MTNKKQKVAHYLEAGQEPHEIEIEIEAYLKPTGEASKGRLVLGSTLLGRLLDTTT